MFSTLNKIINSKIFFLLFGLTTVFISLFLFQKPVKAATCVWQAAAAANWNTSATNWSCGAIPGVNDDVIFNGTSNTTAKVSAVITVGSITLTNTHTGTVTIAANLNISDAGGLSGTASINGGTLLFSGTRVLSVTNGWSQNGGTVNYAGTASSITLSGGDFVKNGGTHTVASNGILAFTGTTTQNLTSNGTILGVVNHTGTGTLNLLDNLTVSGTLEKNNATGILNIGAQTLTFNGTNKLTQTAGDITSSGGTINFGGTTSSMIHTAGNITGTGTLSFTGTGAQKFDTDNATINLNILINKTSGTTTLTSNANGLTGSLTVQNGTFASMHRNLTVAGLTTLTGGTLSRITSTIDFLGGLNINGGTFTGGTTGNVRVGLPATPVNLNHTNGTFTMPTGTFQVSGDFNSSGGTFTPNGTLTFNRTDAGTSNLNYPAVSLVNLVTLGNGNLALSQNLTLTGTINLGSTGNFIQNNFDLVSGGLIKIMAGKFIPGANPIIANGGLTLSGSGIFSAGGTSNLDINGPLNISGNSILNLPSEGLTVSGKVSCSGAAQVLGSAMFTFDGAGLQLFSPGGVTIENVTNAVTGTLQQTTSGFNVTGIFTNNAGSIFRPGNKWTLISNFANLENQGEMWLLSNGTGYALSPDLNSGLFSIKGDFDDNFDQSNIRNFGAQDYYNLRVDINPTDATAGERSRVNSDINVVNDFTVERGTLTMTGANPLTIGGNFVLNPNGIIDVPVAGGTGLISVTGNYTNNGPATFGIGQNMTVNGDLILLGNTLNAPTGNLTINGTFNGAAGGTFAPSTGTVVLTGTNQSILGANTFYNLTKNSTTASTLTLPANFTQTITNTVNLTGTSGNLLSLRSSIPGVQANIDMGPITPPRTLQYLDVKDQNNTNAEAALCLVGCVDSGNNTNWIFAGIGLSQASYNVNEVDGSFNLPFQLTSPLSTTATVNYVITDGTAINGTDYSVVASGTISISNPSVIFNLPIGLTDDNLVNGNRTFTVTLSNPSVNTTLQNQITSATVTIIDNDIPGFDITTPIPGTSISENNGQATFKIRLATIPTNAFTLGLSSSLSSRATVSPNNISFNPLNWNIYQTVTVSGVNNNIVDGSANFNIDFAPDLVTLDPNYNNFAPSPLVFTVTDDDVASLIFTGPSPSLSEEATEPSTFTVRLTSEPSNPVTITLTPDIQFNSQTPIIIILDNTNWNTASSFQVQALKDQQREPNQVGVITVNVSSLDTNYNNLVVASLSNSIDETVSGGVAALPGFGTLFNVTGSSKAKTEIVLNPIGAWQPGDTDGVAINDQSGTAINLNTPIDNSASKIILNSNQNNPNMTQENKPSTTLVTENNKNDLNTDSNTNKPTTNDSSTTGKNNPTKISPTPCLTISKVIHPRRKNDSRQVRILQTFLKSYYPEVKVTGIYDRISIKAVIKLQEKYLKEILAPWGLTKGTGIVSITTRRTINRILCGT